jgi:hypothetical protein
VLPHDSANVWTSDEEFSGRRAFDGWRFAGERGMYALFAETDRLIPWDWADMGTFEQRHWIERGKQGRAALGRVHDAAVSRDRGVRNPDT